MFGYLDISSVSLSPSTSFPADLLANPIGPFGPSVQPDSAGGGGRVWNRDFPTGAYLYLLYAWKSNGYQGLLNTFVLYGQMTFISASLLL